MAFGRFQDYLQIAPGAYEFQLDDGSPLVAQGPEAEQIARMIDASRPPPVPQPGPMLAMSGAGGREDAAAGMSVPDVAPPLVSAAPPGPRVEYVQPAGAQPAPAPAPQAPPPPAATPAVPGPAAQPAAGGQGPMPGVQDYLFRPVYQPGSPGVSREQLQQRSSQGVAVPRAQEESYDGGFEPSPDYLDASVELSIERRLAAQRATEHALAAAQQGEADAVADFARTGAEYQQQNKLAQQLEQRVREDEARYHQLRNEYAPSRVDQHRIFRSEDGEISTAAVIGSAIAQGLGAFGAALAGVPNFAQQIIDNAINRSIRAQEHEIAIRGESADNALSDLLRSTGDLDQAKLLLRQVQLDWVAAQRAQTAAAFKAPEIMAKAQEWDLAEQQRMLDFLEQYRQASLGKHSRRISAEMQYPRAGTRGGLRAPTEAEIGKRADTLGKVQGLEKGQVDIAKTRAETAKTYAEAEAGPKVEGAQEYNKMRNAADGALETGVALARKYGYEVDPQTGEVKAGPNAGFPGRTIPGVAQGAKHQGLEGDLWAFGRMYAGIVNGGTSEPGQPLIESLTPDATATDEAIRLRLQNALQHILLMKKNIDAGAPGQLRQQRAERKQEVNREAAGLPAQGSAPTTNASQPLPAPSPL